MTPELIELARAAMALPGFPVFPYANHPSGCSVLSDRTITTRDYRGIRWIGYEYLDGYQWLPDLTDPATGGVLVSMLGYEARRVRPIESKHKFDAGYRWFAAPLTCYRTQAEAACRVAVDIGGWK